MSMPTVKVCPKFQVVTPKEICEGFERKPCEELPMFLLDRRMHIERPRPD